jgi:hypothetical protein
MTHLKRWLDDPSALGSLEARALAAALDTRPPAGLEDRAWLEFSRRIGRIPGENSDPQDTAELASLAEAAPLAPAATSGSVVAAAIKAAGLGALVGVFTMSTVHLLTSPSASVVTSRPPAVLSVPSQRSSDARLEKAGTTISSDGVSPLHASAQVAPVAPRNATKEAQERSPRSPRREGASAQGSERELVEVQPRAPTPQVSTRTLPSDAESAGSMHDSAPVKLPESQLRAEALELAQAKNLLQQGRARDAEALLAAGARRFTNGALNEERELLTVQALLSLGNTYAARQRAQRFIASHPESPVAGRMSRLFGNQ